MEPPSTSTDPKGWLRAAACVVGALLTVAAWATVAWLEAIDGDLGAAVPFLAALACAVAGLPLALVGLRASLPWRGFAVVALALDGFGALYFAVLSL